MEYRLLILLFYAVGINCECDDVKKELNEMKEKMDKIETLLYKVLIATESHDNGASCLPVEYFEKTKDCLNEGDIMCTSIDLLANKAVCYKCSSCSDNTVVPCKHYGSLNEALHVPDIYVDIQTDGSISQLNVTNIVKKFQLSLPHCSCAWSRYNYTFMFNKSIVQHYESTSHPELLQCQCDDGDSYGNLYCTADTSCVKKEATCSVNDKAINCIIVEYATLQEQDNNKRQAQDDSNPQIEYVNKNISIDGLSEKCSQWETVSDCFISVTFDDNSMEMILANKPLGWTNALGNNTIVNCSGCRRTFNVMCDENFDIANCPEKPQPATKPPSKTSKPDSNVNGDNGGGGDDDDNGSSYTTLLVVIIIVLLVLLLLYVGYQNHQKIISYINGTEGEAARPVPSNRRGRMKGKYAPLPRAMEETIPRHDD